MKQLRLVFTNSDGKQNSFRQNLCQEDLTQEVIEAAMTVISESHLFVKNGVELYATPKAAYYTETIVTPVFGDTTI